MSENFLFILENMRFNMKNNLVNKVKDTFYTLFIVGAGLYSTGCSNDNIPSFEIPKTKIEDKYSKEKSNDLAKQIDAELKELKNYYLNIDDPMDRTQWEDYVTKSLTLIEKSNSIAIRSYFENNNYLENYDSSNDNTKEWLDNRTHNLFYNKNISYNKIINNIDIDAFAQIVKQGDSLSVFDYNELTHKLSEYKMRFADGAELEDYGGKFVIGDRNIILEIYEHNYETITGKAAPKLSSAHERKVDIYGDQTSLREILKGN